MKGLKINIPKQNYYSDTLSISPIQVSTFFRRGEQKEIYHTENPFWLYTSHINSFELHVYHLYKNFTRFNTLFKIPLVRKSKTGGYYLEKIHVKYHLKITDHFYYNDARTKYIENVIPEEIRQKVVVAVAQFLAFAYQNKIQFLEFECIVDQNNEIYMIDFEKGHYTNCFHLPRFERPCYLNEDEQEEEMRKLYEETFDFYKNQE